MTPHKKVFLQALAPTLLGLGLCGAIHAAPNWESLEDAITTNPTQAQKTFLKDYILAHPRESQPRRLLGVWALSVGHLEEAKNAFQEARLVNPQDVKAQDGLVTTYLKMTRRELDVLKEHSNPDIRAKAQKQLRTIKQLLGD